jgi:hypothetical protein
LREYSCPGQTGCCGIFLQKIIYYAHGGENIFLYF